MLEIIGFIEREFGIHVDDRETTPENLASIDRIAAFVSKKSVGQEAARAS
jgi:acyl carrier protein